jgi:hypothetical protein
MYILAKNYTEHPLYPRWNAIIQRCCNPNNPNYNNYGGRGVVVCEDWMPPQTHGFVNFVNDMILNYPELFDTNGYFKSNQDICRYLRATSQISATFSGTPRITFDRINNDGGYIISNTRWVTYKVQVMNRRSSKVGRILPTGVQWRENKQRFQCYCTIYVSGVYKYKHLGYYKSLFDAVCVRKSWELSNHPMQLK